MEAKQKVLKRILVGTDFSRSASHAVVRAALLATEHSAKLEIVHVTPRLDRAAVRELDVDRSFRTGPDPVIERHLEETRALARKHDVTATIKLLKGGAAATLASEAMRLSADLVVVGCRGERSFKDALIGTTAERVLERWIGDTLVVKDAPKENYGTILACVALAPVSCSVVMSAVALSERARLHVLHAYEPPFEMKLISHHASGETLAKHRAAAKGEAVRGLTELLERCPVPSDRHLERHVRHGGPSTLIPGAAVRYGADVIVVGKNQSVLEEFFLGSVTKKIVRAARTDVLVSDSR
ncbi:MAG: universal stress protein [Proteobacteria bacterium]|jgi:nucleotide-binding universal stress UspA family protein|nr:universal stress protein [Pseudomonadota bacterium]